MSNQPTLLKRRNFIKAASASLLFTSLPTFGIEFFANEKPKKVALIGTGWYGTSDLLRLIQVANVEVVSLCDVDTNQLNTAAQLVSERQKNKKKPKLYTDYRTMLESNSLDIVLIGTPDHWHALTCIEALKSGAHVYVQKPISVDVMEGEAMVAAARKYNKVVQVGTQRKSTPHLVAAKKQIIDTGMLGTIGHVDMSCYYHMRANGNPPEQEVPNFFDYEMWTGPAPMRPYDGLPHKRWWRTFREYGNGITGDMCVHMLDTVRWMLDLGWPKRISSEGGIFVQKDGKSNISDTQSAVFEYEDHNCNWQHRTWGNPDDTDYPWAFKIYGEKGVLKGDVMKAEFIPVDGSDSIRFDVVYEKEKYPEDLTEKDIELHAAPATRRHMIDFLNAIQNNTTPVADIENGHISTASCILANLSMDLKRPLIYDPQSRTVLSDPEATALLQRDYRGQWKHPHPDTV
ncbi:MAG TPA: oxidoreductase [Maribacter sp.]|uniref:Gfo/Idh/MocA family protein n=1 Tax=unclassified Maribacter TaxID=2615042 RepID=UPI000EDAA034|nr:MULTISPECIES: Gfo/Idh/MocA family oxidoreductase [unclassified Maribacter]HAF77170.1 oxidoreductase [Maribacter sp.]|tara:strand:- start:46710 stop:48083 length:1374 start_codon:yes stop_codon:yes gene_type:complete